MMDGAFNYSSPVLPVQRRTALGIPPKQPPQPAPVTQSNLTVTRGMILPSPPGTNVLFIPHGHVRTPSGTNNPTTLQSDTSEDTWGGTHQQSLTRQPVFKNSPMGSGMYQEPNQSIQGVQNQQGTGWNPLLAPSRRQQKDTESDSIVVKRLQQLCADADPTKLYRNLSKIAIG